MLAKNRKILAIPGVLFVVLFGIASLCYIGFLFEWCGNDKVLESVSPNGSLKAVVFRRNCGATTGFSTQVSVLPASRELPNDGGNIFVVDGVPEIEVRWIDDSHLSVFGGGSAAVFLQQFDFDGLQINYEKREIILPFVDKTSRPIDDRNRDRGDEPAADVGNGTF
jgi:hypothetical protein